MKFQNCILINFVTDAWTAEGMHGQGESNMPLQLFQSWGLYQLTKFEATCYNSFFYNFHQNIYSLSTITSPSLKVIAVIVFEISNFLSKFAKGNN